MDSYVLQNKFDWTYYNIEQSCIKTINSTNTSNCNNFVASMNLVLSTIENGFNIFKKNYNIMPCTNNDTYVNSASKELQKVKLNQLLEEMKKVPNTAPYYDDAYMTIELRLKMLDY